jgi:hypothetical protein
MDDDFDTETAVREVIAFADCLVEDLRLRRKRQGFSNALELMAKLSSILGLL